MTTTTVEEMAAAFKQMGTPFIVGHPGGESVELMEAAKAQDMRFILMKQEVAGAMLAATWGEITGSPGGVYQPAAPVPKYGEWYRSCLFGSCTADCDYRSLFIT